MRIVFSFFLFLFALALAPLLMGIINRVKAFFAGRRGIPLLQMYYDLNKLLRKGAIYSTTTTWVFLAAPVVGLAAILTALLMVPAGGSPALTRFSGDLFLFAGLLGMMRFVTILSALDTGSSFEGMGASREAQFSAFAEPALFLALAALARLTSSLSLSEIYAGIHPALWAHHAPSLALAAVALFLVFLAENARIPVDDPNTHLELTMIHEVMILDHTGPDLAFIEYASALKFWTLGSLLVGLLVPVRTGYAWVDGAAFLGGMMALAAVVGVVESGMARLRLFNIFRLLMGAAVCAALALILSMRGA
jgi:formate hydrogenlyase subunit 4